MGDRGGGRWDRRPDQEGDQTRHNRYGERSRFTGTRQPYYGQRKPRRLGRGCLSTRPALNRRPSPPRGTLYQTELLAYLVVRPNDFGFLPGSTPGEDSAALSVLPIVDATTGIEPASPANRRSFYPVELCRIISLALASRRVLLVQRGPGLEPEASAFLAD